MHRPIYASWLKQVEVYDSILQRKSTALFTSPTSTALTDRSLAFQDRYNAGADPFRPGPRPNVTCVPYLTESAWSTCPPPPDPDELTNPTARIGGRATREAATAREFLGEVGGSSSARSRTRTFGYPIRGLLAPSSASRSEAAGATP